MEGAMEPERTQTFSNRTRAYLSGRMTGKKKIAGDLRPIEALTFDRLELSGVEPVKSDEYGWLTSAVTRMSDETVRRKMKKYRDSFPTIEDSLAEKIIMEEL